MPKPSHSESCWSLKRPLNRGSYLKRKTSLKESKTEVSGIYLYLCWRITRWCSHPLQLLSLQLCVSDVTLRLKSSGFDAHWLYGVHSQGKVLFWFLMGRISRRWRTVNHAETESPRFSKWWGSRKQVNRSNLCCTNCSETAFPGSWEDLCRGLVLKCCGSPPLEIQRNI